MADQVTPASKHTKKPLHRALRVLLIIIGVIIGLVLGLLLIGQLRPLQLNELNVNPAPINDYDEAVRRAQALVEADKANTSLNPDCSSRYLSQGKRTERVLVIRHGLTNCPRQFDALASEYYARGYTVLIARIPQHGYADRKSTQAGTLTAEETLTDFSEWVDIAHGLGEKVDLMGLSVGANEVAVLASQRGDIDQAILMNPFFGIKGVPSFMTRSVTGVSLTLPNMFLWWDRQAKENLAGPTSAYYGFYTHVIGQYLRMTAFLKDKPMEAKQLIVITNGNDDAVNNGVTDDFIQQWRELGENVTTYRFPESDKLNHDMIDPMQPDARIDVAYPKILELTTQNE